MNDLTNNNLLLLFLLYSLTNAISLQFLKISTEFSNSLFLFLFILGVVFSFLSRIVTGIIYKQKNKSLTNLFVLQISISSVVVIFFDLILNNYKFRISEIIGIIFLLFAVILLKDNKV
ncbi:MAG: hypothetical protein OEZ01_17320 [Candidatus Heimdallarchaeota archaeon]|nr:hypothetical protein [Candidatus Heimdallarchaeota archaeon]MDH5647775.1 hypothetical protein [Candidatus Heimdallarchaeota archaeon]